MKKCFTKMIVFIFCCIFIASLSGCGLNTADTGGDEPSANYTVTYDANGGVFYDGETSFVLTDLVKDAILTEPVAPVRTGYVFDGWSKSKYSIEKWNFSTDTVQKDITLYALWQTETPETYTVTFNANGGKFYNDKTTFDKTNLSYGEKLSEPITPEKENYEFIGWSTDEYLADYWDFEIDTVTGNFTLFAIWQEQVILDAAVQTFAEQQKRASLTNSYSTLLSNSKTVTISKEEGEKLKADGLLESVDVEPEGKEVIYKKRSAAYGIDDLSYYGANNNITYAGSMLKVNLEGTEIAPIVGIKRKPITLSIGLEGATGVDYQRIQVDTITQSTVGQAINQLVKGFTGEKAQLPYMVALQLTEIKAKEEINAALGLSFNVGSYFNLSSEFDFSNKGEQTYAILTLKQIYYTVNVDYFTEEGAFSLLDDSVTSAQLQNACGEGYCPTYVSSVSYGRLAAITIKTSKKFSELNAELNVGGKAWFTETEVEGKFQDIRDDSSIQYNWFVYGGSIDGNQEVLNGKNIYDMLQSLNQPYDPAKQVGVPISYQLSHLADNSSAKIGFVGDYYYAEYVDVSPKIQDGKTDNVSQSFNVELTVKDNYGDYNAYGAGYIANNNFLRVDISQLDLDYIKNCNNNIELKIELSVKEVDDGYQEVYVYNAGVNKNRVQKGMDKPIASIELEHGVGEKNTTYAKYCLSAVISPESFTNDELWIAFDAWGKNEDTWKAKDITVTLTKTAKAQITMYATKI